MVEIILRWYFSWALLSCTSPTGLKPDCVQKDRLQKDRHESSTLPARTDGIRFVCGRRHRRIPGAPPTRLGPVRACSADSAPARRDVVVCFAGTGEAVLRRTLGRRRYSAGDRGVSEYTDSRRLLYQRAPTGLGDNDFRGVPAARRGRLRPCGCGCDAGRIHGRLRCAQSRVLHAGSFRGGRRYLTRGLSGRDPR